MMVTSHTKSNWRTLTTGVPKWSILGLKLFNICISYLDNGTECTLSKAADDTKLGEVADTPEGHAAIQRDLNRLECKWSDRNRVKFNKGKCNIVHRGMEQHQASVYSGSHPAGKHLS